MYSCWEIHGLGAWIVKPTVQLQLIKLRGSLLVGKGNLDDLLLVIIKILIQLVFR